MTRFWSSLILVRILGVLGDLMEFESMCVLCVVGGVGSWVVAGSSLDGSGLVLDR